MKDLTYNISPLSVGKWKALKPEYFAVAKSHKMTIILAEIKHRNRILHGQY